MRLTPLQAELLRELHCEYRFSGTPGDVCCKLIHARGRYVIATGGGRNPRAALDQALDAAWSRQVWLGRQNLRERQSQLAPKPTVQETLSGTDPTSPELPPAEAPPPSLSPYLAKAEFLADVERVIDLARGSLVSVLTRLAITNTAAWSDPHSEAAAPVR